MSEGPVHVVFDVSREAHYVTRALIEWGGILPGRWVDVITTPTRPRTLDDRFGIAQDLLLHGNVWVTTAMPEPASMPPEGIVDAFRRQAEPKTRRARLVAWLKRRLGGAR